MSSFLVDCPCAYNNYLSNGRDNLTKVLQNDINPYNAGIGLYIHNGDQRSFEIILMLLSSFHFIWIPMLWVYGHYKYFTLSVVDRRLDVRIWRVILTAKIEPCAINVNDVGNSVSVCRLGCIMQLKANRLVLFLLIIYQGIVWRSYALIT